MDVVHDLLDDHAHGGRLEVLDAAVRERGELLRRPVPDPPPNIVAAACSLCCYLGPAFRFGTLLPDILALVGIHVKEMHPSASEDESYPKVLAGSGRG